MLKAILIVLLAAVSPEAAARETVWTWDTHPPQKRGETVYPDAQPGWVKLGKQKTYIIYVSPSSIRKSGNNVELLHLYELQYVDSVGDKPIRSILTRSELNCVKGEARTLFADAYSGNMATADPNFRGNQYQGTNLGGTPTGSTPPLNLNIKGGRTGVVNRITEAGKWRPAAPGSTEEILIKFACGK